MGIIKDFDPWFVDVNDSPKEGVNFSDDAPEIDIEKFGLSERIKRLILNGWQGNSGFKSRSEADEAVIVALLSKGAAPDEIKSFFQCCPIGEKYREKGDQGDNYLAASIGSAKAYLEAEAKKSAGNAATFDDDVHEKKEKPLPENLTDLGNGRRLIRHYGDDIRFSKALGLQVWDGRRWKRDNTLDAERMAKATVQTIYAEAATCKDEDLRKKIGDHARRSESKQRLEAMLWMAQSEPGIAVTPDEFDRDPWFLNVENGTLDPRTGELKPAWRSDFITKLAPVKFDPGAFAPTFQKFLRRIFAENDALIGFVKRAFGYALTGSVEEQVLFFFHGSGHNGKTTLIEAILNALGPDYAQSAAPGLLMVKRNESHPTEIADLWGKRMIATIEVGQGKRLAEVFVKQLTGGDMLKGRFMRKDFFQFKPTHKIFLLANHKPVIKGTDFAIWRRIRLVPFNVTIPEAERDTSLPEKLRAESAGILAWCVQGCQEWRTNGLGPPEEVKAATAEYQQEMDVLGDFIAERCEVESEAEVTKSALYEAYVKWAEESGERALSKKEFGMRLAERGFDLNGRSKKLGRFWKGIRLRVTGDTW